MEIREVKTEQEANICDELLTKLIREESEFNSDVSNTFVVKDYFKNVYTKDNGKIFIAIDDDKIVGYIYAKYVFSNDGAESLNEVFLDGLYVLEEYRNKGIATSLFEKAKSWAYEKNVKKITLNVLNANETARNFYKKLGFEVLSMTLYQSL